MVHIGLYVVLYNLCRPISRHVILLGLGLGMNRPEYERRVGTNSPVILYGDYPMADFHMLVNKSPADYLLPTRKTI